MRCYNSNVRIYEKSLHGMKTAGAFALPGDGSMPIKPKRPCAYPGCPELTAKQYCNKHQRLVASEYEQRRGSATSRGYDGRWQKARMTYLLNNPLCVVCETKGRVTSATVVDHIKPHKGNRILFWDESNWQSLCKHCHDRKTAKEMAHVNGKA